MAPNVPIPEGFELLPGRGRENAKRALALAAERGVDEALVRSSTLHNGFLVPLGDEGAADAIVSDGDENAEPVEVEAVALEDLTVADLKALAEKHDIDLGGATKKADIIAAIEGSGNIPVLTSADEDEKGE